METHPTPDDATPTDEPSPVVDDTSGDPPAPFESPDEEHRPVEEKTREES